MSFKAIKSTLFSKNTVLERSTEAFVDHGARVRAVLSLTTEYWDHAPYFDDDLRFEDGMEFQLTVFPSGNPDGVYRWKRVNWGAHDRHELFSLDYQPKTVTPGSIGTNRPGQGGVIRTTEANLPIEAREWTKVVVAEYTDLLVHDAQKAIEKGLRNE